MLFDRNQPYNNLPLLPPTEDLETKPILKQAIASNRMLAELRGLAKQIPNQLMLINGIVLQEAKLSSEIENIVTTNDELYRADADLDAKMDNKVDAHTKEVLRYREALQYGCRALQDKPLTTNLFIEIVRLIKESQINIRAIPGTTLKNEHGEVIYTPPVGENIIRDKLSNLEKFIHAQDDIDPLIKMAVMHYQFEAIHPFGDGNGRTGRILNLLYLVDKGLLDNPILFLSRYILSNKRDYYLGLRKVTEENCWEDWILFLLKGIEETAKKTHEQVTRILALMETTREFVSREAPSVYSKDLIEVIFSHPYTKIQFVVNAGIAKRQTASNYLQALVKLAVLREHQVGREKYYINDNLLKELTR
jgi:Fic family protein